MTDPPSKKARSPYLNSFAKEWLFRNFYEIYQGEEQILTYDKEHAKRLEKLYDLHLDDIERMTDTSLTVGLDLYDKKIIKEITDYNQLIDLGYAITSTPHSGWFKNQKVAYLLVQRQHANEEVGRIPPDHKLYWDVYNKRLKLEGYNAGPNGQGPWVEMEKHIQLEQTRARKMHDYIKRSANIERDYIKRLVLHSPEKQRKIPIEEIPVLIDDQGRLICLPKSRDEPTIGIIGQKGKGKSWCLHGFADRLYWKGGRKIAILNDERSECESWCRPWNANPKDKQFGLGIAKQLSLIGERPLPLPTVYIHAMNTHLKFITHEQECGIRTSFPFKDLISNYENYMKGKEDWELKNSLPYFKNIKEQILKCKNLEEIKGAIDLNIADEFKLTKIKLKTLMEDIYNENMLDMANGISPKLTLKKKDPRNPSKTISEWEYNPFVSLMLADAIPVFETASLRRKGYFPQYFKFIVEDIFRKQSDDPYFINNKFRMCLFCDEIQSIDSKKKATAASEILIKVVTEGRPNRTGFVWASQNPEKLSEQITTNTPYLFVLGFSNNDQAKAITRNFDLMAGRENDIKRLQKLEAIACTSEHFVIYDKEGKKTKSEPGQSFRGTLIPPLSEHKPPMEDAA